MKGTRIDWLLGGIGIRISRVYKKLRNKPDIVFVTENLGFGGKTSYDGLSKNGITAILDLRLEKPNENIFDQSLEYKKIAIKNEYVPTDLQVQEITKWIDEKINSGKKVFIHCQLGRGRAALITAMYLLSTGLSHDTVMNLIQKRKYIYFNNRQYNCFKKF